MAPSERDGPSDQTILREVATVLRKSDDPNQLTFKQVSMPPFGHMLTHRHHGITVLVAVKWQCCSVEAHSFRHHLDSRCFCTGFIVASCTSIDRLCAACMPVPLLR